LQLQVEVSLMFWVLAFMQARRLAARALVPQFCSPDAGGLAHLCA
jgi:hypothetical protein